MRLDERQIRALLAATRETHDVELDCDGFLALAAACAEARADGRPLPPELAPLLEHERLCTNCREELAALVEVLGAERPIREQ